MLRLLGLRPGPNGGACIAPPDPLSEISNILFELTAQQLKNIPWWGKSILGVGWE